MRKRLVITFLLVATAVTAAFGVASLQQKKIIGGLFSLSGNWSILGKNSEAAVYIAIEDVNQYFYKKGSYMRLRPLIDDTKLEPDRALQLFIATADRGIKVVIGPQSSEELEKIKDYADMHGVILISQSSTAHSLAIPSDNIIRMCPSDIKEGEAISTLMWDQGIKAYISMARNDAGSQEQQMSTKKAFTAAGGEVAGGVQYSPDASSNFANDLNYLDGLVGQAIGKYGAEGVAVYLTAFDEVATIFKEASSSKYKNLGKVRWYGSDGSAMSLALIKDARAAEFAEQVGFPCPLFGLFDANKAKWEPVKKKIKEWTGEEADAFALAAYDAVWLVALAYDSLDDGNVDDLKNAIIRQSYVYEGITGPVVLDVSGDRKYGFFDFWAVRKVGGKYQWVKIGTFDDSPESPRHLILLN
ncbi:MAG: ABC transporter substrate-binding protein [Candidatus Margulisiibacteriota bacterium]